MWTMCCCAARRAMARSTATPTRSSTGDAGRPICGDCSRAARLLRHGHDRRRTRRQLGPRPMTAAQPSTSARLAGGVWGHLVGDAVGVPYEFRDAARHRRGPLRRDRDARPAAGNVERRRRADARAARLDADASASMSRTRAVAPSPGLGTARTRPTATDGSTSAARPASALHAIEAGTPAADAGPDGDARQRERVADADPADRARGTRRRRCDARRPRLPGVAGHPRPRAGAGRLRAVHARRVAPAVGRVRPG